MARPHAVLSNDAKQDIDDLFAWLAADSGVGRAEVVLQRIFTTIERVAAMPRIGRVRHDLDGKPRSFSVWPWLIVYEPLPTGQGVHVWRIMDGRRDIPRQVKAAP